MVESENSPGNYKTLKVGTTVKENWFLIPLTLFRMERAKRPLPVFPLQLSQTWELASKTF